MAPVVPIRQPDQQQTNPMRQVNASPDAFGAGIGRALVSAGGAISDLGGAFKQEEEKQQKTNVTDALNQYSSRWRDVLLDPEKGMMNRQGKDAAGITAAAEDTSKTVMAELSDGLKTEDEKRMFNEAIGRRVQSDLDGVANYEFKQAQAYRQESKVSLLDNTQSDVVMHYKDPKALAADFELARSIIRTNADGLSPEGLEKLERQGISSLHLSVIDRLSQDNPGEALDYYEKNKAEIEGKDHAAANSIVKGVSTIRDVKSFVDQTAADGRSISIFQAIEKAESQGQADAVSDQGALGLMQLMPDTAREVASKAGMVEVAGLDDAQLKEFFSTDKGKAVNRQLGTKYFTEQLAEFDGDLEASLIAYNAGPANARKWLNGGRDYSLLPKSSETLPYVRKVLGAYTGIDLSSVKDEDGSRGIQDAIGTKQPGARFQGDSQAFLLTKLSKDKSETHITELSPVMRDGLAAMFQSAPDNIKAGMGILSGERTYARQKELFDDAVKRYGSVNAARKWVAPPGKSNHNKHSAVDLSWQGKLFNTAPADVQKWVHDNASRFGLAFPLGHEPWHIEDEGARKGDRPTKDSILRERMMADQPTPADSAGRLVSDGTTSSPAALYTQTFKPYTVQASSSTLEDQLAAAETRFADNPVALAEATRQLTNRYKTQAAEQKAATDQLEDTMYRSILGGTKVEDMDRNQLATIGEDGLGRLMQAQSNWDKATGANETDLDKYQELKNMSPEEFRDVDLNQYFPHLSKTDAKAMIDQRAALRNPNTKDGVSAGMRTRTQIGSSMADMLGLDPKAGSADAKTVALLERAADEQITAWKQSNPGKDPDAITVQKIYDQLVMTGEIRGKIYDTEKRVFELTPEEKGQFYPGDDNQYAGGLGDIPIERQQKVAQTYASVYGSNPSEQAAVSMYNDILRVDQGAAPTPPDDLMPQIRQYYMKARGTPPSLEEAATFYRALILKSTSQPTTFVAPRIKADPVVEPPMPVIEEQTQEAKPAETTAKEPVQKDGDASADAPARVSDILSNIRRTVLPTEEEFQSDQQAQQDAQPVEQESGVISTEIEGDMTVEKIRLENGVEMRRYYDKDGNVVKDVKGW